MASPVRQSSLVPDSVNPETDLGRVFVRFPKPLFDALLLAGLPATHLQLTMVIVRETYGHFGRDSAAISLSLFARLTGRSKRGIQRTLAELVHEGIVQVLASADNRMPTVYSLNPNPAAWGKFSVTACAQHKEAGGESQDDRPVGVNESSTPEWNDGTTPEWNPASTTIDGRYQDSSPTASGAEAAPADEGLPDGEAEPAATPSSTPVGAQSLVAHAITYARSRALTPPSRGHLGRQIKELLVDKPSPELLERAVEKLVDMGATPARLRYILGDLERDEQCQVADPSSFSARKRYCMEYFEHHLFLVCGLPADEERELKAGLLAGTITEEQVAKWT